MNDFTKKELESIHYCLRQMQIHIDGYDKLKQKIQTMIDNYCEHNEREGQQDEDGKLNVVCTKCNLQFWHEED